MSEFIGDYQIIVIRGGVMKQYYQGWVETIDGKVVFNTAKLQGLGCKKRALELCRNWVEDHDRNR